MHPGQRALIQQVNAELEIEWREERAAILEFDGGMTKSEAEAAVRALRCPFGAEL